MPAQPRTEVSCQPLGPQGEFQAEGPAREKAQSREGSDLAWGGGRETGAVGPVQPFFCLSWELLQGSQQGKGVVI